MSPAVASFAASGRSSRTASEDRLVLSTGNNNTHTSSSGGGSNSRGDNQSEQAADIFEDLEPEAPVDESVSRREEIERFNGEGENY